MNTLKQNFAKIAFFAFLVGVLVFGGPAAVKRGAQDWKYMMADRVPTGPVQYPVKVTAIGKYWTGLAYVDVKQVVGEDNRFGGRYQGKYWENLAKTTNLQVGDTLVFRANTTTWYYGREREVVVVMHPLTEWRLITDRLTTEWKPIGKL